MADTADLAKTQLAEANFTEFMRCYDTRHRDYVIEATTFDNYYHGNQWTEQELANLGDKPALTINISKKTVNAIYGNYSNSRVDFQFKASKDSTFEQAMAITGVVDNILENNNYQMRESFMFMDGVIKDRGYLEVLVDFNHNLLGEVQIRHKDPRDVVLDPEAKEYDPETWSQIFDIGWYSINQIEALYGKSKADQVKFYAENDTGLGSESIRFGATSDHDGPTSGYAGPPDKDAKRVRAVRVIKRQHRKLGTVRQFVDPYTLDVSDIPESWTDERVEEIAAQYQLMVRKVTKERIRWTVSADRVILFDDWSPYNRFTIIPYFPYFTAGRPSGVMRDLISPQDQLNKAESQELHVVNTTANSGYMVEAGSLVNMTPEELEERGAQTGLVVVYGKGRNVPVKIQPNQIPTGMDRISSKAAQYLIDIPGAATLVGQMPSAEVSGVTLERTQSQAILGLAPVMDNLKWTRHFLALNLLDCVQSFYTEYRMLRVTDLRDPEQPQYDLEINSDVLNNVTLGKYDVVVSTAPARDTAQDAQFAQAFQMREAGILIPDYHVILSSNLHNKRQIAEETKRLQGLAEPSPEEAQLAQMQQQLQMEALTAELQKLQASIDDLAASAELKRAQAAGTVMKEQRAGMESEFEQAYRMQQMRADIAKQIANLMNKLELAGLHTQTKKELTRYTTMMKSIGQDKDRDSQAITAQINAEKPRAPARALPRKSR